MINFTTEIIDITRIALTMFGWYLAYTIRRPRVFRFKLFVVYSLPLVMSILSFFDLVSLQVSPIITMGWIGIMTILYWREMKDLTTSEGYHRSVVSEYMDKVPDMIWMKDKDRSFTFTNQASCDSLFLCSYEKTFGKTMEDLTITHPENTLIEQCRVSDDIVYDTLKPGKFVECGLVNGNFVSLQVHKVPLFKTIGSKKEFIGIICMARDLTYDYRDHKEIGELWCDDKLEEAFVAFKKHAYKYMNDDEVIKCIKESSDEEINQ